MKFVRRLLVPVALALALVAGACGGEDPGDQVAFCDLLSNGFGVDPSTATPGEYDALAAVAPPEMRPVVRALQNSAASIDEIAQQEPIDLEALYKARFDPGAEEAVSQLNEYATGTCLIDLEVNGETDAGVSNDLVAYLGQNFGDAAWLSRIAAVIVDDEGVESAVIQFTSAPESDVEAETVCNEVAFYLYRVRGSTGSIAVQYRGVNLMLRSGPDALCQAP